MRHVPTDKYDKEELKRLNAPAWMVKCLKLNPDYISWGPFEDYMAKDDDGWDSRLIKDSFKETIHLNDLNECVNFYFEINRENKECDNCNGTGYHRDALWVSESFYRHSSPFAAMDTNILGARAVMAQFGANKNNPDPFGRNAFPSEETLSKYGLEFRAFCKEMAIYGNWNNRITKDEAEALQEAGRVFSKWNPDTGKSEPTGPVDVEAINIANHPNARGGFMMNHDGINRGILIETRLKRLGIPLHCEICEGHGRVFTVPEAKLSLVLWILHPRKGCSRGVMIKNIEQSELPEVYKYLREAAKRNAKRFSKIPKVNK